MQNKRRLLKIAPSLLAKIACVLACLACLLLSSLPSVVARDIPITTKHIVADNFGGAARVTTVDLDGDGDPDILGAAYLDDQIAWWENAGDGSITATHTITDTFAGPAALVTADLDGDGDPDILATAFYGDQIAWWENAGDGSITATHVITDGFDGARSVYPADLDGDGDLDILGAASLDHKIAWWENGGSGTFTVGHVISTNVAAATSVYPADLDGDGDLDVLGTSFDNDQVLWWENDGSGSFASAHTITDTFDGALKVYAGDLDHDGDTDVLGVASQANTITWWENTAGDGSLWSAHTIVDTFANASWAHIADVDGDGDLDVLGTTLMGNQIIWWENDGSGSFASAHPLPDTVEGASSVHTADLDGDGDLDILGSASLGNEIAWWENDTIHRSATLPIRDTFDENFEGLWDIQAADIDGDGDLDILGAATWHTGSPNGWISWWRNEGGNGSAWTEFIVLESGFNGAVSVRAADLDGDGDLDILGAAYQDNDVAWWENAAGDGSLWNRHDLRTDYGGAYCVRAADVDGDGDMDVIAGADSKMSWWENNGTPSGWTEHLVHNEPVHYVRALHAGDFDGDGDADIAVAITTKDYIAWYENDGAWTKHWVSGGEQSFPGMQSLYGTDLDRDGDQDLIATKGNTGGEPDIVWLENDGSGGGWEWHVVETDYNGADGVYATDLDLDGDIDIVCAHPGFRWWENEGDNLTWTVHVIYEPIHCRNPYAADIDGDGDDDVLCGHHDNPYFVAWWSNRGGQFALETSDSAPAEIVAGEFDDVLRIRMHHRGRPGDRDEELTTLDLLFEQSPGTPLDDAQANALIENLHVYLDDGSGIFDPAYDTLILSLDTLTLTDGRQTVTFADPDPDVRVVYGIPRTYFVVPELTTAAYYATPNQFLVTHITEDSSTAEDADADIPLLLEWAANVPSAIVQTTAETDLGCSKDSAPDEIVPGLPLTYTIVITTAGPSDVQGATVLDYVPHGLMDVTWTCLAEGGGVCTTNGTVNINDTVDVPVGGQLTYVMVGTVGSWFNGTLVNTVQVDTPGDVLDPNPGNDSDEVSDTSVSYADLGIAKTSQPDTALLGRPITYTIIASNPGPSDCSGASVVDPMPAEIAAVTWTCAALGGAACTPSGAGDIDDTVDLPAGGSVVYTVRGTMIGLGPVTNTATVTTPAGVVDPNEANNSASEVNTPFGIYLPIVFKG